MIRRPGFLLIASVALSGALLLLLLLSPPKKSPPPPASAEQDSSVPSRRPAPSITARKLVGEDEKKALVARELLENLQRLLVRRDARAQEGLLTFKDTDAYQRFLARAGEAGLTVLGQLDNSRTVRVRYDDLGSLQRDVLAHAADYADVGANFLVSIPQVPPKEERAAVDQFPFGNRALQYLGVAADHGTWGRGTTIAIVDSGVNGDATFGQGRLRSIDVGLGTGAANDPGGGHGTAIAALAAGFSPDAPGVSPAANLLSLRVTDASGTSDIFTVARAIQAAADAGAKIINISLGGYGTNSSLNAAITYASERGAIIVAAAGNDQAAQLTWPAADPRVVSVGAIDASGQQVSFSNSGEQLQITAPGYGVQTAWLDGQRVSMNGTSASAPLVSGAIAAVMSENPGFTAQQAWEVLQRTANDSGAPGADPSYGNGILNLGWAMNRNNPTYHDSAIASHYYDAASNEMEFVIQNRSGQALGALQLQVSSGSTATTFPISPLAAGATTVVRMPVDQSALKTNGGVTFSTQLINPGGMTDRVPANNRRSSTLAPVAR